MELFTFPSRVLQSCGRTGESGVLLELKMSPTIKTSRGEVTFSDVYREYRNDWSCLVILKDDCFGHSFSLSTGACKYYDTLWPEIVVVYDNAFCSVSVPATECMRYTQSSLDGALLGYVVKDVVKNLRDEQISSEMRDGDTAFIYGQRRKSGYKVLQLQNLYLPKPQVSGEWELLGALQKRGTSR
ncbi:hypothetical protein GW937_02130 [Candidatus Kaiserbacteria bacterium]|nr:hypothetical protein [Candidatus Kaiserbacteria bacterium]NCT01787.1 hypothetical protein [Candidatus Parcubacteria bacterium]